MTRDEIRGAVFQILADQMGVSIEKITEETNIYKDLGADSLDSVEIVMELEDEFEGIGVIPDEEGEKLVTVKQIIDYVEQKLVE